MSGVIPLARATTSAKEQTNFNYKVTKVARTLAAKPTGVVGEHKSCSIMALLDGGTLKRQKTWLKVEPFCLFL